MQRKPFPLRVWGATAVQGDGEGLEHEVARLEGELEAAKLELSGQKVWKTSDWQLTRRRMNGLLWSSSPAFFLAHPDALQRKGSTIEQLSTAATGQAFMSDMARKFECSWQFESMSQSSVERHI